MPRQVVVCNIALTGLEAETPLRRRSYAEAHSAGRVRVDLLCLALFVIAACSMQEPGSSFDSSKSTEKKKQPENRTAQQQPPGKKIP